MNLPLHLRGFSRALGTTFFGWSTQQPAAIVGIGGGVGNQLFIYSTGLAYARKHNRQMFIDRYAFAVDDRYHRKYKLDQIGIRPDFKETPYQPSSEVLNFFYWLKRINKFLPEKYRVYIDEEDISRKPSSNERKTVYLEGFWQDYRYFADFTADILKEIKLRNVFKNELKDTLPADAANKTLVGVHLRRHDYHLLLPRSYYEKAFHLLRDKVPDPLFLIFGDDFQWADENLDFFKPAVQMRGNSEIVDLSAMAHCRHLITANSTFSWWGAYINQYLSENQNGNSNSIIIAPEEWNRIVPCPPKWILV